MRSKRVALFAECQRERLCVGTPTQTCGLATSLTLKVYRFGTSGFTIPIPDPVPCSTRTTSGEPIADITVSVKTLKRNRKLWAHKPMATYNQLLSSAFGATFSELGGILYFTVLNDSGTKIARTHPTVTERTDGGVPTGTYDWVASFDTDWGSVRMIVDFEGSRFDGIIDEQDITISVIPNSGPPYFPVTGVLTARQRRFYVWTVDRYRKPESTAAFAPISKYVQIATQVPVMLLTTPNDVEPTVAMRQTKAELFTFDMIDEAYGNDALDNDVLVITGGPSGIGTIYRQSGNVMSKAFRANMQRSRVKYGVLPEGLN